MKSNNDDIYKIYENDITLSISKNEYVTEEIVFYAHKLVDKVERSKSYKFSPQLRLAVLIFENAAKTFPNNLEYKLVLARLHLWQGNFGRVIELCNVVLETVGFDFLASHFLGISLLHVGQYQKALESLEPLNKISPQNGLLAWNLSNAYFHAGDYYKGWFVFNRANEALPNSYPEIPKWDGQYLGDKTIVLTQYNSAGGGDDIMLAEMLPDIIQSVKQCYVEVDPRSEPLYRRSFPAAEVFLYGEPVWSNPKNIDFQLMVSDLGLILRKNKNDFATRIGYLKADQEKLKQWGKLINSIACSDLKVGICWRSLISIGLTGNFSSEIEEWRHILKTPGVCFFDLQYDDSDEERFSAEKRFGVKIHKIKEIDMMTDFDNLAAIYLSMDLIITTVTTVAMLANAVGAKVWEVRPKSSAFCMSCLPWFPERKIYYRDWQEPWEKVFNLVGRDLAQMKSSD